MTKTAKISSYIVGLILVLVPFHALLTVWLSSGIEHYTALRLWDEVLLTLTAGGAAVVLWQDRNLRRKLFAISLSRLMAAYIIITLVWAAVPFAIGKVTAKAVGYGLVVNLRFLIFFLAVWAISAKAGWLKKNWPRLIFWPALLVIVFGILQVLVLRYDFLKHFGYSSDTIFPYETVNHNLHYVRAMSTLRGANPLGAYLLLIISAASVWMIQKSRQWWMVCFSVAALVALALSYSREAWLGLVAVLIVLVWLSIKNQRARRLSEVSALILIVLTAVTAIGLRHNPTFQNYILHTQSGSSVKVSSNAQHISALHSGLHDIAHQPLGRGVGTAGPASVYNGDQARITENYFVQIAQETGWLGLALFVAIYISVAWQLWLKRQEALALTLLISLIGLTVVSMFSHSWTDDTLAYLWWGLAGIALSADIMKHKRYVSR